MLTTLLAWFYITFLCWTWGILFLHVISRVTKAGQLSAHFSIICIAGLSIITIVAGTLSLFIPLGEWWVQFTFIIPALFVFFIKNTPYFLSSLKKELALLRIPSRILLSSLLFLILTMSSWQIIHPDTLGYHAQTIQWIEKYKAVPGIVHLHSRLGYQGFWFVDCALFDFTFTGAPGIAYLNSTVLCWFLVFIVKRINFNFFYEGKNIYGFLWLGLLVLSMWSFTQIRLTATSASPDFVATLFVLATIYLLVEKRVKHLEATEWVMAALFSIVAVTIKLSTAPVILIAFVAGLLLLIAKKTKLVFALLLIVIVTFSSFIARNIITSGYPIFPSATFDVADVDWKFDKARTINERNYIAAYAKKQGVVTTEEIDSVNNMPFGRWVPGWWENRSAADKIILVILLISILTSMVFAKKIMRSGFIPLLTLLTMGAGLIFWFSNAPDPRFGFGFIFGFIATIAYLILKEKEISIGKKSLSAILVVCSLLIMGYTVYRFINFFRPDQLITPLGIQNSDYKTFDCEGIKINSPTTGEFGIIPVPCTDHTCGDFSPRGDQVPDGFRAK